MKIFQYKGGIEMLVLLGKTASGKDSVMRFLCKKYGLKKVVTYTTRPMRTGEINGETYYYISKEEFLRKVKEGFFFEYKKYETVHGDWYYGAAKTDLDHEDAAIILTPAGFTEYLERYTGTLQSVYLDVSNEIIQKRFIKRGDEPEEAKRRLEHDNEDFLEVESMADLVIDNEGRSIESVAEDIWKYFH